MQQRIADNEKQPESGVGTTWQKQINEAGEFKRHATTFRNWLSRDGSTGFKAEPQRYHLYVSYACPWAHRTLVLRALKGLTSVISVDVTDWLLPSEGWRLEGKNPGSTGDTINGKRLLREVYGIAESGYQGSVTVPVLWDKQRQTIVNNESADIIRMFNSEFQDLAEDPGLDLYPEHLQSEIEAVNEWVYEQINDGVYRAGFARSQRAHEDAARGVFEGLERAEALLAKQRYLTGNRLTLADIRLWTTLVRFDMVYATHFKCNWKRLVDYPNLWAFTRELYAHPKIRPTVFFDHIKHHYYESHESVNPYGLVPIGPKLDFDAPHDRDRFPAA